MHSKQFWSLKHDLTLSLGLNHSLIFPKSYPTLHKSNGVRADPYAPLQLSKILKYFVYI